MRGFVAAAGDFDSSMTPPHLHVVEPDPSEDVADAPIIELRSSSEPAPDANSTIYAW